MRISHKHKFIFFAVPKTASTTIRACLNSYSDVISVADKESPLYWHVKPRVLKKYFEEQHWNWNEYFKFTFVRNTWSRILSMYVYRSQDVNTRWAVFQKYSLELSKDEVIVSCLSGDPTPSKFKKYLKRRPYVTGNQIGYIDGCDFVGKLENLQQDFNVVCDNVGIPHQQLPIRNKTEHKHYTEYYDDETRELVATVYKDEIAKFGYVYGE